MGGAGEGTPSLLALRGGGDHMLAAPAARGVRHPAGSADACLEIIGVFISTADGDYEETCRHWHRCAQLLKAENLVRRCRRLRL